MIVGERFTSLGAKTATIHSPGQGPSPIPISDYAPHLAGRQVSVKRLSILDGSPMRVLGQDLPNRHSMFALPTEFGVQASGFELTETVRQPNSVECRPKLATSGRC